MKIFIRSASCISPQSTFEFDGVMEVVVHDGDRMKCIEPDYKEFIDSKSIRRMSRNIRLGVTSALQCLRKAGVENPGAIVTGTAYGCLEDSITFLEKMIRNNEEMLAPAAFIQSTHNTVGAQIALMLKCHGYNNTFVNGGHSFESALLDSMMLLREGEVESVLAGSVDEITDTSHKILKRFGLYNGNADPDDSIAKTDGTVAGEGAAFFLLTGVESPDNLACVNAVETLYCPANPGEIENFIFTFLEREDILIDDIDLVVFGKNGDKENDKIYDELEGRIFKSSEQVSFKHMCGEYPTAVSFAMWTAAQKLKGNIILNDGKSSAGRILIYNHYLGRYHTLLLLSSC